MGGRAEEEWVSLLSAPSAALQPSALCTQQAPLSRLGALGLEPRTPGDEAGRSRPGAK